MVIPACKMSHTSHLVYDETQRRDFKSQGPRSAPNSQEINSLPYPHPVTRSQVTINQDAVDEAKMASEVKPAQPVSHEPAPPTASSTTTLETKDTPSPGCGPQDSAEDGSLYDLPTKGQLDKAFKLDVLDKDGNKHTFGELCHNGGEGVERNLVIFIRHWFCGVSPVSIGSTTRIYTASNC